MVSMGSCWTLFKGSCFICRVRTAFQLGGFGGNRDEDGDEVETTDESMDGLNGLTKRCRIHRKTENDWRQSDVAFGGLFVYSHGQL